MPKLDRRAWEFGSSNVPTSTMLSGPNSEFSDGLASLDMAQVDLTSER